MDERTTRLAALLSHDFGVGYRDRVAVLAHNNTNFFEVQFACWKLGAVFTPLNWRLAVPELEYIVNDCGPAVIIHDREFAEVAARLTETTTLSHRIDWEGGGDGADSYEEAIAAASPSVDVHASTHDDIITIMYTSGTTGRPKGAMITHGMTLWNAVNSVEFFNLGPSMVNLVFLPLFHTGGLNCFANPAYHFGGCNVVLRAFEPSECLRLLTSAEVGVTHFLGVPANFMFMSQVPEFETAEFPTVKHVGVGGSPTPLAVIETWASKGLYLQQGFGMTETSPLVTALKAEDAEAKIGSAGQPVMHTEVRIVGDDGADVAQGEVGELWVRGPNVTAGYWNNEEATAHDITDGWLHTGDAARQDGDGFFYVVDRWKDMYISGGENVYPAEVENVIYELDAIAEVSVFGVPDPKWVEVGRACVVLKTGESLDESTLLNHCRQKLARYKVPHSVIFVDALPRNATGKVLKRELRETYGAA